MTAKNPNFGKKGFVNMKNGKFYIHVKYDGKTYFISAKTVNSILNGSVKKGAYIFGYK
jgi:hypothetical protein